MKRAIKSYLPVGGMKGAMWWIFGRERILVFGKWWCRPWESAINRFFCWGQCEDAVPLFQGATTALNIETIWNCLTLFYARFQVLYPFLGLPVCKAIVRSFMFYILFSASSEVLFPRSYTVSSNIQTSWPHVDTACESVKFWFFQSPFAAPLRFLKISG